MRDREGVKMDKRTKVKTRSHAPLPFFKINGIIINFAIGMREGSKANQFTDEIL